MNDMEMNILSRLAMLKISNNVSGRFFRAQDQLDDEAYCIAVCIKNDDRTNPVARSLLEWAEEELGIEKPINRTEQLYKR